MDYAPALVIPRLIGRFRAVATKRAKAKKRRDAGSDRSRKGIGALNHPWRVRVIEVLSERDMSVAQFVDEGLIDELAKEPRDHAISLLAHHFRLLIKAGLIEVVGSNPKRGSHEHICRAQTGAHHTVEEWAMLPQAKRQVITPMTWHSLAARAEGAIQHNSFDNRIDRHLAYVLMELDERAWSELGPVLDGMLDIVMRIRDETRERLAASGEQPIRAVYGAMLFESPPLPEPAND